MKNRFTLFLFCSLLLAGCAGKKAMNEQAAQNITPVVAEQQAPAVPVVEATPVPPETVEALKQIAEEMRAVDRVFFDFDSYQLTHDSRKRLEDNALWMRALPEVRVSIEGHADERGADSYNLALGEKRAQTARDYLVNLGIAPERIAVISYGKEKATKGAAGEAVWAQDRRAEFVTVN